MDLTTLVASVATRDLRHRQIQTLVIVTGSVRWPITDLPRLEAA